MSGLDHLTYFGLYSNDFETAKFLIWEFKINEYSMILANQSQVSRIMYRKVASTSPFDFEACAGLFRLSTNKKFVCYFLWKKNPY